MFVAILCYTHHTGETCEFRDIISIYLLQIDAHIDTLVSEQASFILHQTELAHIYAMVQQHQPEQVRSQQFF